MRLRPIPFPFLVFTILFSMSTPSNAFFSELFTKIKDKLMGGGGDGGSQFNGGYSAQGFENQQGGFGGGYQQQQQQQQYGQLGQQFGINEQKYEHYGQQGGGGGGGQFVGAAAQQQQPQLIGADPNGPNPYAQNPFGQYSEQQNGGGEKEEKGIFSRMTSWLKNKAMDLISKGKLFSSGNSNSGDDK